MKRNFKLQLIRHIGLATFGLLGLMLAFLAKAAPTITYPYDRAVLTSLERIQGYDTDTRTTNVSVALFHLDGDTAWNGINWVYIPGPWLSTFINSDRTWLAPGKWRLPKILPNGYYRIYAVSRDADGNYSDQSSVAFTIRR